MSYRVITRREEIRRNAGVSFTQEFIDRLDVLRGNKRRTTFVEELLVEGLTQRFTDRWAEVADHLRTREEVPA